MKVVILTIFKCTIQWHKYVCSVVQPLPLPVFNTFSSSQTDVLDPLSNSFLFLPATSVAANF